jgi:hypothetical protein
VTACGFPIQAHFEAKEDAMDPNDPLQRGDWQQGFGRDDARSDNATWGWVAAAVFVAIVLFIAFTSGHDAQRTASNDLSQTAAATRTMMPPAQRAPLANPAAMPLAPPATDQPR